MCVAGSFRRFVVSLDLVVCYVGGLREERGREVVVQDGCS